MRPPTGSLVHSRAAWDRAPARQGQRLTASLTLAPACLRLPLAWSARPLVRRRRLPVSRPTVFFKVPLTASALCEIFLERLKGAAFRESFRGRGRAGRGLSGTGAAVAVAERAGGVVPLFVEDRVAASGVALPDHVVAVLADYGGLAPGPRQRGPHRATAPQASQDPGHAGDHRDGHDD